MTKREQFEAEFKAAQARMEAASVELQASINEFEKQHAAVSTQIDNAPKSNVDQDFQRRSLELHNRLHGEMVRRHNRSF